MHRRNRGALTRTYQMNSEHATRAVDGISYSFQFSPALTHATRYYIGKVAWAPNTQDPPSRAPRHVTMHSDALGRISSQSHRHTAESGRHRNSSRQVAALHRVDTGSYIANEPLGTPQWLNVAEGVAIHNIDFAFWDHAVALSSAAVVGPIESYDYVGGWAHSITLTNSLSAYDYEYDVSGDTHYLHRSGVSTLVQYTPYEGYEQTRLIEGTYVYDPNGSPANYTLVDNSDGTGSSGGGHFWHFEPTNGKFEWDTYVFAGTIYGDFASATFTWTATAWDAGTISGGHTYTYDGDYVTVLWDDDPAQWYKLQINESVPSQLLAVADYNDIWPADTVIWTHQGTGFRVTQWMTANLNPSDQIRFWLDGTTQTRWRENVSSGTSDPVDDATLYTQQNGTYDGDTTITYADSSTWTGAATPGYGTPDPTLAPAEFVAEIHFQFSR